jgi:hypothetical protein
VGKKFFNILNQIKNQEGEFLSFLEKEVDAKCISLISTITQHTDVYIFSGVIRNFFLNRKDIRDIDIIIDKRIDLESILNGLVFTKNSFGGYKVDLGDTKMDLWFLRDTWALNNKQMFLDISPPYHIPRTSFFNFSAIIYSMRENKFIFSDHFINFLSKKVIDIVYEPNPNEALCIVNSFYYSDKYNLKISVRLQEFIASKAPYYLSEFEKVQEKHFGEVLYSEQTIIKRITELSKNIRLRP